MTKNDFYAGQRIISVEWWLHDCDLPALTWARLRVFDDGTADANWEDGGILYAFDEPRFAGHFLAEDEYRRLSGMDADDEQQHGIRFSEIRPPAWSDSPDQGFKYLGMY